MNKLSIAIILSALISIQLAAGEKKVVLFDLSHGELFLPTNSSPLDHFRMASLFRNNGYGVRSSTGSVKTESLKRVNVFVVNGAMKEFSNSEIRTISDYIHKGGNVLILLHISSPVARLTELFGIVVSNFVVHERAKELFLNTNGSDFLVNKFQQHPLFDKVKNISVYGSWGLNAEGRYAKLLASTSAKAYADLNQNNRYELTDAAQSFGIAALAEIGKGKLLVISDDAIFNNSFLSQANNEQFAKNIIDYFSGKKKISNQKLKRKQLSKFKE